MFDKFYTKKFINIEFAVFFPKNAFLSRIPFIKLLFALLYPKYGVIYFHRQNRRLFIKKNPLNRFYFLMNHYLNSAEINPNASLGQGVKIPHPFAVVIGGNTVLGDNCVVMSGVTFGANSAVNEKYKYPMLGKSCYVGTGAKIIGAVEIGSNSTIGGNSLVTKSFKVNSVIVGIPGKLLMKND
jgi:serine O-acetyltransferase